jgi:hypothetical protein
MSANGGNAVDGITNGSCERGENRQQHADVEGSHCLIRVADEALIFGESGGFPPHKKGADWRLTDHK